MIAKKQVSTTMEIQLQGKRLIHGIRFEMNYNVVCALVVAPAVAMVPVLVANSGLEYAHALTRMFRQHVQLQVVLQGGGLTSPRKSVCSAIPELTRSLG
jgi:hypothetical protein